MSSECSIRMVHWIQSDMAELIKAAGNKEKALHRAFDVCIDPMKALEEAIELGFDTILTSGQKRNCVGRKRDAESTSGEKRRKD